VGVIHKNVHAPRIRTPNLAVKRSVCELIKLTEAQCAKGAYCLQNIV